MVSNIRRATLLYPYRAFHNQVFNEKVILFFFIPPLVNLLFLALLPTITKLWGGFFTWFLAKMGFNDAVGYIDYQLVTVNFSLPYIDLYADLPTFTIWWSFFVLSLVILLISGRVPEPYTPLKYFLRAFVFLLTSSLFYFYFFSNSFPYNIPLYSRDGLLQIISLCLITPWVFGFTYYIFSYNFINKIVITLLTLLFLVIGGALQVLTSSWLINVFSLIVVPCMYIFFGLLINVFAIVAFYAYGVSIEKVFFVRDEF
jgi:hypothetical protein